MDNEFLSIEHDGDIAVVTLDHKGRSVNTLSTGMLGALDHAVDELTRQPAVRGIVLISGKTSGFVVGADINELGGLESPEDARALTRRGHAMIRKVRSLRTPVVAAIDGPALGGGLELALACDYRVAAEGGSTRFGLPEVRLGLIPGGGGTQLLPRLVGIRNALGMMLTGKNTFPHPARKMGLVDLLTHREGLRRAAVGAARDLADGKRKADDHNASVPDRLLDGNRLTRKLIFSQARERVLKETRGNFPAPIAMLECVRIGYDDGLEAGLEAESAAFAELLFSDVSRELIFLFHAQQRASKIPFTAPDPAPSRLAVIGGGLMGGGIAAISAENGMDVTVKDVSLEAATSATRITHAYTSRKLKKHAISSFDRDRIVSRVLPIDTYAEIADPEIVIEAVPEDLTIKREVIREVEAVVGDDCVIASNTSSIPIESIAEESVKPERIVGMHYFSPVPQMPLMEVIRTRHNTDEIIGKAFSVGLRQKKTVIVVNDGPGFYTTRILAIYMNEALNILAEGARIEDVDRAMKDFGFPMGPFELFDLVGIDVAAKISEVLSDHFSARGLEPNPRSGRMSAAGLKGRKTKSGFYLYDGDSPDNLKKGKVNVNAYAYFRGDERQDVNADDVQGRLSLVLVNEAIRCLEEGILNSAEDGDVGAVFGLGFPPFLGGPFRYADALSADTLVSRLESLRDKFGPQFEPATRLRELAADDGRFYD